MLRAVHTDIREHCIITTFHGSALLHIDHAVVCDLKLLLTSSKMEMSNNSEKHKYSKLK